MQKLIAIVIVFISCWSISNASVPRLDGRIIGGTNASILEYPYQISLRKNNQHICGGSIFHSSYILTAAHCVSGGSASQFSIKAGSEFVNQGGVRIKVCSIRVHEKYDTVNLDNDIAILKLCSPLIFSNSILPIAIPGEGEQVAAGTSSLISGWGYEVEAGYVSVVLKKVDVPIVDHTKCKNLYAPNADVTSNMICAGYVGVGKRDACQGDSGGPLRANGKLMGIVSWGFGCARAQFPGVYTKVSSYRSWIKGIANY